MSPKSPFHNGKYCLMLFNVFLSSLPLGCAFFFLLSFLGKLELSFGLTGENQPFSKILCLYLLYLPIIEAISFHLHKYLVHWTPHLPFSFSSVIFHLRSFSKDGHEWAYMKDFYRLGTFGLEPNPSLVNEQHLQTSSPKYHNQVMLPVGADTPT